MLADSVESATRALKDPTRERIRDLIDSVVDAKISAGQLDEAPITLAELSLIKEQFTKVLGGVYHSRIDYPETRHLTEAPANGTDPQGESEPAAESVLPSSPAEVRRSSSAGDGSQLVLVEDPEAGESDAEEDPS